MFIDEITIKVKAGDGGNGCLSFRKEAYVPKGGPDGGDGGKGGDIILKASKDVSSLVDLMGHREWTAPNGTHGEGSLCHGKYANDVTILVPVGTLVRDAKRGHLLRDLASDGEEVRVVKGGDGGHGNRHFATSTNRAPREYEEGHPGEVRHLKLELKLIADVGLLGKPNAGKSTLLSRLSKATPEIAAYPFTTKSPNLGMVRVGWDRQFVIADIPGLIEGAHEGIGLGHQFLRHVERTRLLIHLVEPSPMDMTDPVENYKHIREELRLYSEELASRPEILVITKCESPDAETAAEMMEEETGLKPLLISALEGIGLETLTEMIFKRIEEMDKIEAAKLAKED